MNMDGVQLIANVLRAYRGSGAIVKGVFKAVAALCEGKNPASDKRRDECVKLRIHVLVYTVHTYILWVVCLIRGQFY